MMPSKSGRKEEEMRIHRTVCSVWFLLIAWSSIAQAGLLEPVYIYRSATAYSPPTELSQYGTGVDPFSATVAYAGASATQDSTITADTITISGSAAGSSWVYGYSEGTVLFREKFSLASPTPYRFSFAWDMNPDAWSNALAWLEGPSGIVFRQNEHGSGTWSIQGFLEPGQYDFNVTFASSGSGQLEPSSPMVSVSATLSLTPEPATAALLGLGALGLLRRRRHR